MFSGPHTENMKNAPYILVLLSNLSFSQRENTITRKICLEWCIPDEFWCIQQEKIVYLREYLEIWISYEQWSILLWFFPMNTFMKHSIFFWKLKHIPNDRRTHNLWAKLEAKLFKNLHYVIQRRLIYWVASFFMGLCLLTKL